MYLCVYDDYPSLSCITSKSWLCVPSKIAAEGVSMA